MVISPEMFNTEGDLSFLTYFSEPEPERAPWPTSVGGGYVIQYGGRNWMYPPPTAVGRGALYTLLLLCLSRYRDVFTVIRVRQ